MAFTYQKMIRQAALRVSAITGTTQAAKETSLTTSPLTTSVAGSVEFPLTALVDAAVGAAGRLVRAYANVEGHPFRAVNASQTAAITSGAVIPAVDSANKSIVGVYGPIVNGSTGALMTEQPKQIIDAVTGDAQLKRTYNYARIVGNRYFGTASGKIDVCVFDEATERTAAAGTGNAPLPDALFDAAWCAMAVLLMTDDAYSNQAQIWNSYVENVIAEIRGGQTEFGPAPK